MNSVILLILVLLVGRGNGETFSYTGYQVIRATPLTPEQAESLRKLHDEGKYDFWSGIREKHNTDIMVEPGKMVIFMKEMSLQNISTEVVVSDVEKMMCKESLAERKKKKQEEENKLLHFVSYHSIAETQEFLRNLSKENPKIASTESIGKSTEGRDMLILKVSTGGTGKKGVWVDGNIHAREWITTPMVSYIANELVKNSEKHSDLLSMYDFYLLPSVNPDGYEFTRTTTRLHRKTRSQHACTTTEIGVDANRNWGYKWNGSRAITDPCNNEYNGPSAFSEPENASIRDFITKTQANWTYYISFHSRGEFFLIPFGDGQLPDDYSELKAKGDVFNDALKTVRGSTFSFVGNWASALGAASGISQDWAKAVANIKYSFTIELTRGFGFVFPPDRIKQTVEETWVGLKAMWLS